MQRLQEGNIVSSAPALEAQSIVKSFGGLSVLDGLNVVIGNDEIVGLIGPNGAGKTTFFNIITGFIKPDSGNFHYFGKVATGMLPYQIAKLGVARTFQIIKPFPSLRVKEAVMIGAYKNTNNGKKARELAEEVLKQIGIQGLAERKCSECNLMQTKLVDLARCMATKPKIILADELAAGLNPMELNELAMILKEINKQNVAICAVEHVFKFISSVCTRIVVLHQGKIIASGSPKEIADNADVITAYLGEFR